MKQDQDLLIFKMPKGRRIEKATFFDDEAVLIRLKALRKKRDGDWL